MKVTFEQINKGWNADPNSPLPNVEVLGSDVRLSFCLNAFVFPEFEHEELGILRFLNCERYRFGATNDEGWYRGQCRFSKLAPTWGEFYLVSGDNEILNAPLDWAVLNHKSNNGKHYLFYFRDETFECVADQCISERSADNALSRIGFKGC